MILQKTLGACLQAGRYHAAAPSAPQYDQYPPRYLEPATDPRSWAVSEVQDWIESIGFFEYREAIAEGSVDGPLLLTMNAESVKTQLLMPSTEHIKVLEMEIAELRARRGLLSQAELRVHLVQYPLADAWSVAEVGAFLQRSAMGKYAAKFAAARVDGRRLLQLRGDELAKLVSIAPNPHEENEAALEQLVALVDHLRWRSTSIGGRGQGKQEL